MQQLAHARVQWAAQQAVRPPERAVVQLEFVQVGLTLVEGDEPQVLEVRLDAPVSHWVTAELQGEGHAQLGQDYALPRTQIAIAPGQTSASIMVWGMADESTEGRETGRLALTQVRGAQLGERASVELAVVEPNVNAFGSGPFQSDDFAGCEPLATRWTLIDPAGDATASLVGAGSSDAHLRMTVAGGSEHQPWNTLAAPHLVQSLASGNFEIEVAFTDRPADDEIYGLLIKEDNANWLRFDFYGYGGTTYVYTGRTRNGRTSNRGNWSVAGSGGGLWMRVARSGNSFTLRTSTDGVNYTTRRTYSNAFGPVEIGPYVGNFGSNPAGDMEVDYVFDLAFPITPEDAGCETQYTLDLSVLGSGSISVDPTGGVYAPGTVVNLVASPASGWEFDVWSGALNGTNPVAQVTMDGDRSLTAHFIEESVPEPPVLTDVQLTPGQTTAQVTWNTDVPADSKVDYGLTSALGNTVSSSDFETQHALFLTQLLPGNTYFVQVTSATPLGVQGQAGPMTMVTQPSGPVIISDDFNTCGGPAGWWTFVDLAGQGAAVTSGMGGDDALVEFSSAANVAWDAFGTLDLPYLSQPMADGDFEIVAKLQDAPVGDRSSGLLFIESPDDWLSMEIYDNGSELRATGVWTQAGSGLTVFDTPANVSGTIWVAVERTGDVWDFKVSQDGVAYTVVRTLNLALDQNEFGLYGGNRGALPSVASAFDYVEDTRNPLVPEDGPIGGEAPKTLSIAPAPSGGAIAVDPDLTGYACDEVVSVEAQPAPGYFFVGWSGDLSGSTNPTTITLDQDRTIGANFALIAPPPVISNVLVVPAHGSAVVTWQTDVPASSRVDYGMTAAYGSFVENSAEVTDHQLTLPGLDPETLYHFQVQSTTAGGSDQSADATFTTQPAPVGVVISDDFNGCGGLGNVWNFVDSPFGDGSVSVLGAGTGDAHLAISVPAGVERQNYNNLNAPRVMQPIADVDFEVELKFDSDLAGPYKIQGLLVQQDASNWLRFDLYSSPSGTKYYAGSTVSGTTQQRADGSTALTPPYYLRVGRVGDQWTYSLSGDGQNYQTVASFNRFLNVNEIGPYAGNATGASSPAFTAMCDYVFDTLAPIEPEDGAAAGQGPYIVDVSVPGGGGSVQADPQQADYNCGEVVTYTPQPAAGFLFSGWGGAASGSAVPLLWTVDGDANIIAQFVPDGGPPMLSNVQVETTPTTATISWETNEPATSRVDYGTTTALGQVESQSALVTQHSITLTGLDPVTQYFYQLSSTDADLEVGALPRDTFQTGTAGSVASDDFHEANLNLGLWTFTDPAGAARLRLRGSGTADAQVEIEIPGGVAYEPYLQNGAARLSQPVADEDFTFQVKFETTITNVNTNTGIYVEKDVDDWIRLDYYFDGSNLNVFSARFIDGNASAFAQQTIQSGAWDQGNPLYLRIERSGVTWSTRFSTDGIAWSTLKTFQWTLAPERIGILCGNTSSDPQAQTVVVDWFENPDAPIVNEDPAVGADGTAPYVYDISAVPLSETALQISWATEEISTGQVQWGTSAAYGQAPVLSSTPGYQHTATLFGLSPDTLYHFQVEASDASSNTTFTPDQSLETYPWPEAGAPEVEYWYGLTDGLTGGHVLTFGELGNAQPQWNVLGRIVDNDQDRVAQEVSLEYRLNGGAWQSLALGDDRTINYAPWRLANEGDFNVELYVEQLLAGPLQNGVHRNTLELRASDDGGHVTRSTTLIDYHPDVTWNAPLTVDWSLLSSLEEAVQVIDGLWEIHDHPSLGPVLRPDPAHLGYDRLVALGEGHGDDGWDNYEALLPVTVHALDPQGITTGTGSPAMGFLLRWTGHTTGGNFPQPNHGLYPLGGLWVYRWFQSSPRWELWIDENEEILPQVGNDISVGVTYWYRVRCEDAPGGGTLYAFKVWEDGQSEPANWTFEHTTNPGDPKRGSFVLVSHHVDVSFGNIVVTPLP